MGTAPKAIGSERIQLFAYPASTHAPSTPDWQGWSDSTASGQFDDQGLANAGAPNETESPAQFEKRLADEIRRSFEAGRERGHQEGRQAERETHAVSQNAAEALRLRQRAELIENFAQERDRYLHAIEQEVVKLALAVAARILRREAQMDPLLLTGAVRVALGQLAGSTEVRLRVPAEDLGLWTESIALIPNLAIKPALISGEGMRLGDCTIETSMGSVDLGVRSQLGEIERGFFDRAGAIPSSSASDQASSISQPTDASVARP
jgi:flagellar assembly protein FliH